MLKKIDFIKLTRLGYLEAYLGDSMGNSMDKIQSYIKLVRKRFKDEKDTFESIASIFEEMSKHDFSKRMSESYYRMGVEEVFKQEQIDKIFQIIDPKMIKDEIITLRTFLTQKLKIARVSNVLSQNSYSFNNTEMEVDEMDVAIQDIMETLQKNNPKQSGKSSITESVAGSNKKGSLRDLFARIKSEADPSGVWKVHLQGINDMLQGGFRDGQLALINGRQHSYKSGLTLSMFLSLALLNPPRPSKREGKPTLVWLSMEDDLKKVMGDVYGFLKVWDDPFCDRVELKNIDPDEAERYVNERLDATGYNVEFHRVDSSDYSFSELFDDLTRIEMEGNSIRVVGIDYIANIPKTGCSKTGATGADSRELLRRIRNWMQARGILCLSPHQLNPAAKQLIKDGLPGYELVPKVLGNGYTADSSQLDQELDVEIAVNPFVYNDTDYLMVGCGKHKLNSVIEDRKKLIFITDFPKNGNKIQPDVLGKKEFNAWYSVADLATGGSNDIFG